MFYIIKLHNNVFYEEKYYTVNIIEKEELYIKDLLQMNVSGNSVLIFIPNYYNFIYNLKKILIKNDTLYFIDKAQSMYFNTNKNNLINILKIYFNIKSNSIKKKYTNTISFDIYSNVFSYYKNFLRKKTVFVKNKHYDYVFLKISIYSIIIYYIKIRKNVTIINNIDILNIIYQEKNIKEENINRFIIYNKHDLQSIIIKNNNKCIYKSKKYYILYKKENFNINTINNMYNIKHSVFTDSLNCMDIYLYNMCEMLEYLKTDTNIHNTKYNKNMKLIKKY